MARMALQTIISSTHSHSRWLVHFISLLLLLLLVFSIFFSFKFCMLYGSFQYNPVFVDFFAPSLFYIRTLYILLQIRYNSTEFQRSMHSICLFTQFGYSFWNPRANACVSVIFFFWPIQFYLPSTNRDVSMLVDSRINTPYNNYFY